MRLLITAVCKRGVEVSFAVQVIEIPEYLSTDKVASTVTQVIREIAMSKGMPQSIHPTLIP